MNGENQDRRVRRTRTALRAALVELIIEQGYDSITVDRIAQRADLTRATFYVHYTGKEDLLTDIVDRFVDDVLAAFERQQPDAPRTRTGLMIERSRHHRDLLRLTLDGQGDGMPFRRLRDRVYASARDELAERMRDEQAVAEIDVDLVLDLRVAQILAGISWAIDHPEVDAEEAAARIRTVVERGMLWATNLTRLGPVRPQPAGLG